MTLAISRAAPLKPEIRLAQAISEFQAHLPAAQKAIFDETRCLTAKAPPSMHSVMVMTAEFDGRPERAGLRSFGTRMVKFLGLVQRFASLGDILVGASQNLIAAGVWTVVRLTLMGVVSVVASPDHLTAFFMRIGHTAPCFEELGLLYNRSKALQNHIAEYFIIVVQVCHKLYKSSRMSTLRQMASSLCDSDLSSYERQLNDWAQTIKTNISLLASQDQVSSRNLLSGLSKSQSESRRRKAKSRVLNSCSKYDFQTSWTKIRKSGTTSLFTQAPEYTQWQAHAGSCTLICKGQLGAGKSVWLANMVDHVNLHVQQLKPRCSVAYFFCRHDIAESLESGTIFSSLVRQLLADVPDLTKAEEIIDQSGPVLGSHKLLALLKSVCRHGTRVFVVLDGLDECEKEQQYSLIECLLRLGRQLDLHLCLSLRSEANNILNCVKRRLPWNLVVELPKNNPDIDIFIAQQLRQHQISGNLAVRDQALLAEIEDALSKGAQGMFLWVALQLESLCEAQTDQDINDALANLPRDLPETYHRIMQKAQNKTVDYQERILKLVVAAQEPLTLGQLREALSVVIGDVSWDPSRVINDIKKTLACCGSLVIVDEDDLGVRLVHGSFKQFLLGQSQESSSTVFTVKDAHDMMARTILTYLNYPIFETQISPTAPRPSFQANTIVSNLIDESLPRFLGQPVKRNLTKAMGQSSKLHDFDINKVLHRGSRTSMDHDFELQSYAKRHVNKHVELLLDLAHVNEVYDFRVLAETKARGNDTLLALLLLRGAKEWRGSCWRPMMTLWQVQIARNLALEWRFDLFDDVDFMFLFDFPAVWEVWCSDQEMTISLSTFRDAYIQIIRSSNCDTHLKMEYTRLMMGQPLRERVWID
ncbi:hypothetical protein CDD81_1598 [Ophiocordyceps australis]|uniref:Uncharacterized protein n=1 Tax=Ophiocordyceps australis TaxID=1399860 RepID=A0A2C5XFB2_9HYPO|nr:hypothetical protein CDD81_1598 [Ophiocordyceps australis]